MKSGALSLEVIRRIRKLSFTNIPTASFVFARCFVSAYKVSAMRIFFRGSFLGSTLCTLCIHQVASIQTYVLSFLVAKCRPWSYHNGGSWPVLLWQVLQSEKFATSHIRFNKLGFDVMLLPIIV